MPHSTARSQADKAQLTSSVQSPPPAQGPEEGYIIPGRLTHAQWTDALIQEDGDETVAEIMEELLSKVTEGCLKVYIEKQLAPYSASWAKGYLTQILERQSMCVDEGEDLKEARGTEDPEPTPAPLDAWAQGCVPVVNQAPQPHLASQQGNNNGQVTPQSNQRVSQQCDVTAQTKDSSRQSKKETIATRPVSDKPSPSRGFSRYSPPKGGKVLGNSLPPLPCSAEKKDVEVKSKSRTHTSGSSDQPKGYQHSQGGMPSLSKGHGCRSPPKVIKNITQQVNLPSKPAAGKLMPPLSRSAEAKDAEVKGKNRTHTSGPSDQRADYQRVPRLDRPRPPRHGTLPQFEILENGHAKPYPKKPREPPRLEPIHDKQRNERTAKSPKPPTGSKNQAARQGDEADARLSGLPSSRRGIEEETASSGRLRLDTVQLARGVSLHDPQAVGVNSFKRNPPAQTANELRPIRSDVAVPPISLDEVTSGPPPRVTALPQSQKCDS